MAELIMLAMGDKENWQAQKRGKVRVEEEVKKVPIPINQAYGEERRNQLEDWERK